MDLSPLLIPLWHRSPDGSAVIGREGFVFLYSGSNDVASLYAAKEDDHLVCHILSRWLSIIESRFDNLKRQGIDFVQIVIPEKSTVLTGFAPPELTPITPHLKLLEEQILSSNSEDFPFKGSYVSILKLLRTQDGPTPFFMRTDSHLSSFGAFSITNKILHWLETKKSTFADQVRTYSQNIQETIKFDTPVVFSGDLARRFFDAPLYENYFEPSHSNFLSRSDEVVLVSSIIPEDGHHLGIKMVWLNSNAPIKLKILVFGNSFFERGSGSRGLSWWFKNIFSEFHFIWSPDIDYEYVERVRPDVVICQTVERFLKVIPTN